MTDSDFAQQQLRVIRSLMEKATVYRAISAPTALLGGLLSLGGFATAYDAFHFRHHDLQGREFLLIWLVILLLTALANVIYLWRSSVQQAGPFFSSGMKLAMVSLAPAVILAVLLMFLLVRPIDLALSWITLYGFALLGTQHFAPRSLVVLGWSFFLTGCALLPSWHYLLVPHGQHEPSTLVVSGLMAATFGGYHLLYAVAVWAHQSSTTPLDHV